MELVNPSLARISAHTPGHRLIEFMPEMRPQGLQAILGEVRRTGVSSARDLARVQTLPIAATLARPLT